MSNKLLIEKTSLFTKYAVVDDKRLKFIKIIKDDNPKLNEIYLGKVIKKNPLMQGFVLDIFEKEVYLRADENLAIGDCVLVKIDREKEKEKMARANLDISISNKYAVIIESGEGLIFSKKLKEEDVLFLNSNLSEFNNSDVGILIRTSAVNEDLNIIKNAVGELIERYKDIKNSCGLGLKYSPYEYENYIESILDIYNIESVYTNDIKIYKKLRKKYLKIYDINHNDVFLFNHNGIDFNNILKSDNIYENFDLKIDYLEALTVIDINSGYIKQDRERNQKIFEINRDAFLKILDIINIYNLGGVIIVDFISMNNKFKNKLNEFIEKTLKNIYNIDRKIFCNILTESCLMEVIVEKRNQNLIDSISQKCDKCCGSGLILSEDMIMDDFEIILQSYLSNNEGKSEIDIEIPRDYSYIEDKIRNLVNKHNLNVNVRYGRNIRII